MGDDSIKPVKKLTIVDPRLEGPVSVEIPWDLLPEGAKSAFLRLDHDIQNDSGEKLSGDGNLVYCSRSSYEEADPSCEITYADGSAATFFRYFWAFQGDAPYNNFKKDNKDLKTTQSARRAAASGIQGEIYEQVVVPLQKKYENDPEKWRDLKELLIHMADPAHLYNFAHEYGIPLYERTGNPEFLYFAEECLMEAKRLAASPRWARKEYYDLIEMDLASIQGYFGPSDKDPKRYEWEPGPLEKIDEARFQKEIKGPYILLGRAAPKVLPKGDLDQKNEIVLRVSIPKGYSKKKIIAELNRQNPRLRPSRFRGGVTSTEYRLEAKGVVSKYKIDPASSFVDRIERLTKVLFEEKEREYLYVSFAVKDYEDVSAEILAGREIRKFDLVLDIPGSLPREIPGGVVIHDKKGKEINVVIAGDLHISEQDYEIKKMMVESLLDEEKPGNQEVVDRIERFYESINEKLEAAVEIWNREYREGKLDYVVLNGDLVDFINIATTFTDQGYRGTNFRRLVHILSKLEAPMLAKVGNHDLHIYPFPQSVHRQRFADDSDLYGYVQKHYDADRFNPLLGIYELEGLKDLLTQRIEDGNDLDFLFKVIGILTSDKYYKRPNDTGLRPYYRHMETHEADVVPIGNKNYLNLMKSGQEDFHQQKHAFEQLRAPRSLHMLEDFTVYVLSQLVSSIGMLPEVFRHFLQASEVIEERGGKYYSIAHYGSFYKGQQPGGTPDAQDTLRGPVNNLLRLTSWLKWKESVEKKKPLPNPIVFSSHVHRWGEYVFDYILDREEEGDLKKDIENLLTDIVLQEVTGDEVYEGAQALDRKYLLPEHLEVTRHLDSSKGFPGPLVQEFNRDSDAFGKEKGPLFVNTPSLGPNSPDSPSGWVKLTIGPDGKSKLMPYYQSLEPDGTVDWAPGTDLPALKERHRNKIREWKLSHGEKDPKIPTDEDGFKPPRPLSREEQLYSPPLFDPAPGLCAAGQYCFGAGVGLNFGLLHSEHLRNPLEETSFDITFQVSAPLSRRHHSVWGLNKLRADLTYNTGFDSWFFGLGVNMGIADFRGFTGLNFDSGQNVYGVEFSLLNASAMVVPSPKASLYATPEGDVGLFFSLDWMWEAISLDPHRGKHEH
jgi:hypothetical protein